MKFLLHEGFKSRCKSSIYWRKLYKEMICIFSIFLPYLAVMYSRNKALSWMDPSNWCVVATPDQECLDPQPPLLDTERIPCSKDSVVFPAKHTFYIDLKANAPINIGMLMIQGKVGVGSVTLPLSDGCMPHSPHHESFSTAIHYSILPRLPGITSWKTVVQARGEFRSQYPRISVYGYYRMCMW